MDYGKLAYMKAEELEARMRPAVRQGAANAGFTPDAAADGLRLTEIRVGGSAVLLVKLTLYAPADLAATLELTLDGMTIADAAVSLQKDVRHTEMVMGCVDLSGTGILALRCDDARVTVERVEIGLVGDSAGVTREASDFRFARRASGGAAGLATSQVITVYPVAGGIGTGKTLCRGNSFDLCATPEGYAVLNCDPVGNLWLRTLDEDLTETGAVRVGDALDSPTLTFTDGRLVGAGLIGGSIVVFSAVENAVTFPVPFGGAVDAVYFVKDAPRPILAVTSGGKVFIKTAADVPMGNETVAVKAQLYAVADSGDTYTWN